MRSERRSLKCSACPAVVTVEMSQRAWAEDMARCVAGVARFVKWDIDSGEVRCPLHARADAPCHGCGHKRAEHPNETGCQQ